MKGRVLKKLKQKLPKKLIKFLYLFPVFFLVLCNCESQKITQQELGNIAGKVYSTVTSLPVSNASVSCGNISITTDANGVYFLSNVPVGRRTVTASKEGYELWSRPINVRKGSNTLNIFLISSGSNGDEILF